MPKDCLGLLSYKALKYIVVYFNFEMIIVKIAIIIMSIVKTNAGSRVGQVGILAPGVDYLGAPRNLLKNKKFKYL